MAPFRRWQLCRLSAGQIIGAPSNGRVSISARLATADFFSVSRGGAFRPTTRRRDVPADTEEPMDRPRRATLLMVAVTGALLAAGSLIELGEPSPHSPALSPNQDLTNQPPRLLDVPPNVRPVAQQLASHPPVLSNDTAWDTCPPQTVQWSAIEGPQLARLPAIEPPQPPSMNSTAPRTIPSADGVDASATSNNFPVGEPDFQSWTIPDPTSTWNPPTDDSPETAWNGQVAAPSPRSVLVGSTSATNVPLPPNAVAGALQSPTNYDRSLTIIEGRVTAAVQGAFTLAERGALFTARNEMLIALRSIAEGRDTVSGDKRHTESLAAALRALEEAEDFKPRLANIEAGLHLENVVISHRTPVLKHAKLESMTAIAAMQQYYAFAQEQFVNAVKDSRAASLALYGLGKLQSPTAGPHDAARAMFYYQAALAIDPQNHLAANELGVLFAAHEQWEDAKRVFLQSIRTYPLPQTWHNLAVVHERLGERDLAALARNELVALTQKSGRHVTSVGGPMVHWVTPNEFAMTGETHSPTRPAAPPSRSAKVSDYEWWKPWTWF